MTRFSDRIPLGVSPQDWARRHARAFFSRWAATRRLMRRMGIRVDRRVLAEVFFRDLYTQWEKHGSAAIARACFHDPVAFTQMIARLMPEGIEVKPDEGMSDERLAELLKYARKMAEAKKRLDDDPEIA